MKIKNQTIAFVFTGLLLGLGDAAHATVAGPTYTYTFEASEDQPTIFNGSTVTISTVGPGEEQIAYSIVDTDLINSPFTGANDVSGITYNTTDWDGSDIVTSGPDTFTLSGTPDYISESSVVAVDPLANGVWTNVPGRVPDASSTFPLLLGVLAMLAGVHYCNRPLTASLARL